MSRKKFFCPNCGSSTTPDDKFCLSCGHKLADEASIPSPAQQPQYQQPVQQSGPYSPAQPYAAAQPMPVAGGIPRERYMELKPKFLDRFLAYLVDGVIFGFIGAFCPIVPLFKDMIPEAGKSFGKSMLKLKVVNYDTGHPIKAGQACVRSLCFILPFDLLVPLCTEDGRRIGDMVANTIVLEDR